MDMSQDTSYDRRNYSEPQGDETPRPRPAQPKIDTNPHVPAALPNTSEPLQQHSASTDNSLTSILQTPVESYVLYKEDRSPGKGKGLYASRDLAIGTRIMSHPPVIILPESDAYQTYHNPALIQRVIALPSDQLKTYLNLPVENRLMQNARSRTNAIPTAYQPFVIDMNSEDQARALAIWDTHSHLYPGAASRHRHILNFGFRMLNHSCTPNAVLSYNNETGMCTVQASKPIHKNEEIFIPYFDILRPHKEREAAAIKKGFVCLCRICHGYGGEGPARLGVQEDWRCVLTRRPLSAIARDEPTLASRFIFSRASAIANQYRKLEESVLARLMTLEMMDLVGDEMIACYTAGIRYAKMAGSVLRACEMASRRVYFAKLVRGAEHPDVVAYRKEWEALGRDARVEPGTFEQVVRAFELALKALGP
ncbi:SET domain-containing protein [Aulographum hederae CBS 113979]|uniref:SET domain-containing protein n=1 Tax=Aulographum hederae CBS 113979 TaxID=1176131 RepID=A0A6G1GX66_9PEZI|nr:SET domain-containing protein [Aulographum hederae CBS 113979]